MFRRNISQLDKLILVESPTKVSSYNKYLQAIQAKKTLDFGRADLKQLVDHSRRERIIVKPTIGHMHSLSAIDMPVSAENSLWRDFKNCWTVSQNKKDQFKAIKSALAELDKNNTEVIIATDPDREGELIGSNVFHDLPGSNQKKFKYSRMYVHAITEEGIEEGLKERQVRFIDHNLVAAADTRSAMDQIFGFVGSSFVRHWQSSLKSIGRVQTPSLILVSKREAEIQAAKENKLLTYYGETSLDFGKLAATKKAIFQFEREVVPEEGEAAPKKNAKKTKWVDDFVTQAEAQKALAALKISAGMKSDSLELSKSHCSARDISRSAPEPLTMQTLILEASRNLGMSSEDVARSAQNLFHAGVITYPRTDSIRIQPETVETKIKSFIVSQYGKNYFNDPASPDAKKSSKKKKNEKEGNIEDAHEAIHPTQFNLTPGSPMLNSKVKEEVDRDLYEIIFNTTVAAFMIPSVTANVRLGFKIPTSIKGQSVILPITASKVTEEGWKMVLKDSAAEIEAMKVKAKKDGDLEALAALEGEEEEEAANKSSEDNLFEALAAIEKTGKLSKNLFAFGGTKKTGAFEVKERKTKPPASFTEGTLIQELKRNGVGRPSTYPTIVKTLKDRGYVKVQSNKIKMQPEGEDLVTLSQECFPGFVDLKFTEKFEAQLNVIAKGEEKEMNMQTVLNNFFSEFGLTITTAVRDAVGYKIHTGGKKSQENVSFTSLMFQSDWLASMKTTTNLSMTSGYTGAFLRRLIPANCGVELIRNKKQQQSNSPVVQADSSKNFVPSTGKKTLDLPKTVVAKAVKKKGRGDLTEL